MYELTISLSENEQMAIGNELDCLFVFQDRPLSKEKKALLIQEICKWGIPSKAIISGLRKLMTEDLKNIKLVIIKEAASEFVFHEEIKKPDCDFCEKRGIILMRDEKNYEFSFACHCGNGERYRKIGMALWEGDAIQIHRGKTFSLRFAHI